LSFENGKFLWLFC